MQRAKVTGAVQSRGNQLRMVSDTDTGDYIENKLNIEAGKAINNTRGGPIGLGHRLSRMSQRVDQFADDMARAGLVAGGEDVVRFSWGNHALVVPVAELEALCALLPRGNARFGQACNPRRFSCFSLSFSSLFCFFSFSYTSLNQTMHPPTASWHLSSQPPCVFVHHMYLPQRGPILK